MSDEIRRLWEKLADSMLDVHHFQDAWLYDNCGIVALDFRTHRRYATMPERRSLVVRPCSALILYEETKWEYSSEPSSR